jgi:hypothetical protein
MLAIVAADKVNPEPESSTASSPVAWVPSLEIVTSSGAGKEPSNSR